MMLTSPSAKNTIECAALGFGLDAGRGQVSQGGAGVPPQPAPHATTSVASVQRSTRSLRHHKVNTVTERRRRSPTTGGAKLPAHHHLEAEGEPLPQHINDAELRWPSAAAFHRLHPGYNPAEVEFVIPSPCRRGEVCSANRRVTIPLRRWWRLQAAPPRV